MKNLFTTILLLTSLTTFAIRKVIVPDVAGGYYNFQAINPGDTVVLQGNYQYITFINRSGTAAKKITLITNGNVFIKTQLSFISCQYWDVIGSNKIKIQPYGDDTLYNGHFALNISDRSKCFDVSGIFISNAGIGVNIKSEPSCDVNLQFPNFVMDSIFLHDMTVEETWNQGYYVGNTAPDNGPPPYYSPRPVICNGITTYPRPLRMGKIKIYNCIIRNTGRSAIQISSASEGICEVYNNYIRNAGIGGDEAQSNGVLLGSYTRCIIYDNDISNTFAAAIASQGACGPVPVQIRNNITDSSGYLSHYRLWAYPSGAYVNMNTAPKYANTLTYPYSVFLATRPNLLNDSTTFWVQNNIFKLRKNVRYIGVADYQNTFRKRGNLICNNNFNTVAVEESYIPVFWSSNCTPLSLPPDSIPVTTPRVLRADMEDKGTYWKFNRSGTVAIYRIDGAWLKVLQVVTGSTITKQSITDKAIFIR